MGLAANAAAAILSVAAPRIAARMVPPHLFAVLVLAAGANCVVQILGTLLRAFKREPFFLQSLAVASLTLVLAIIEAPRWGNAGAAFSYLAAMAGFGLPSALTIFMQSRRGYLDRSVLAPSREADRMMSA
jgi:hypothetical protein